MKNKIMIKSIVIVVLLIVIVSFKYFGININNNSNYKYNKDTIEGLKFKEIEYMYDPNKGSYLTVKISNLSNKNITMDGIKVISKDSNGKVLGEIEAELYVELSPGENFNYLFFTSKDIIVGNDSYEYIPNIIES